MEKEADWKRSSKVIHIRLVSGCLRMLLTHVAYLSLYEKEKRETEKEDFRPLAFWFIG